MEEVAYIEIPSGVKAFIAVSLMLVMLGMGLTLTGQDFKNILKHPKALFVGILGQLILLPLFGFALVYFLDFEPAIAVGIILLAACPGGVTSNMFSHLAKGNLALSISMTVVASFVTIFSIPFLVNYGIEKFDPVNAKTLKMDAFEVIKQIFAITVIPVSIGMFFRRFTNDFADRVELYIKPLAALSIVAVTGVVAVLYREHLITIFMNAGLSTFLLNFGAVIIGILLSILVGLNIKDRITVGIETGVQNSGLAILIAANFIDYMPYAFPALAYTIIQFITVFVLIYFGQKLIKN